MALNSRPRRSLYWNPALVNLFNNKLADAPQGALTNNCGFSAPISQTSSYALIPEPTFDNVTLDIIAPDVAASNVTAFASAILLFTKELFKQFM